MAPKPGKLAFIFATVLLVAAAIITINTWTAAAKHDNGWKALSAPGTIYRSGLLNVY
jgi:hypothetical protein